MDDIFYTSELEFASNGVEEFVVWFAGRHASDLYRAGFSTCASYKAVEGEYTIIDFYQAPTWDVFLSAGYKARAKDPYAKDILAPVGRSANTVYAYLPLPPDVAGSALQPVDSDWISLLRFEGEADGDGALIKWLVDDEIPRLRSLGAETIRLIHRTKDRPIGARSTRPRLALVTEWAERPPPLSDLLEGLGRHLQKPLTPEDGFIGVRSYPWPDRKNLR